MLGGCTRRHAASLIRAWDAAPMRRCSRACAVTRAAGCAVVFGVVLAGAVDMAGALSSRAAHGGGVGVRRDRHFAVGKLVLVLKDRSRRVRYPGRGSQPRTLVTVIRYPAKGDPSRVDVRGAAPARSAGPFPLIVFAHGFDITPGPYRRMLQAWARAGYVVATPTFPLTSSNAPGGPRESDLVNQPADMSLVISRMLAADAAGHGVLSALIESRRIGVSGQSDGGSTALAVAYNSKYVDHRIRAAMILSGAEIPGVSGYDFPVPAPPLLAAQGTADTSNAPKSTYRYFRITPRPKFLLSLLGAPHLGPYTNEQPQLGVVERETLAFLDRYLKRRREARARMWKDGNVRGLARLSIHAPP
jgi:dienelactone hydrolase